MGKIRNVFFILFLGAIFLTSREVYAEVSGGRRLIFKYHTNGGNAIDEQLICSDDACENICISSLPTPVRDGYTFVGWYENEGLTKQPSYVGTGCFNPNIESLVYWDLYAKWEQNSSSGGSNSGTSTSTGSGTNSGTSTSTGNTTNSGANSSSTSNDNLGSTTATENAETASAAKTVVKVGNTGINQNSLFVIIGSMMILVGSVIVVKKIRN